MAKANMTGKAAQGKQPAPAAGSVKAKPATAKSKVVAVKKSEMVSKPPAKPAKKEAKQAPKAKSAVEIKDKIKKAKLVRDSFTMPETEYAALGEVKKSCLKAGVEVKKSQLLRIGVALVRKLDLLQLKEALETLAPLKAGRPKKDK